MYWILFIFLFALGSARCESRYEAESAQLLNGARADDSAGGKVRDIGGPRDGTVVFNHVIASRPGLYAMQVFYTVSDDRSFTIAVNTNTTLDVIFRRTAPRKEEGVSSKSVLVPLAAGTNEITFSNAHENGPDLDCIVIGEAPIPSRNISGSVGRPGVTVMLSGFGLEMKTTSDGQGRYEFPFVPDGEFYVRPQSPSLFFSPFERIGSGDFVVRSLRKPKISVMQMDKWRIEYDLANGTGDIFCDDKLLIAKAFASVRLPESLTSMDSRRRKISRQAIQDGFGRGVRFVVESGRMRQNFCLYENVSFFLTDVAVTGKVKITSNHMAPLVSTTPSRSVRAGDLRCLFVPFDNDKWIRYSADSFGEDLTSYEVSAFYDNATRQGAVVGSIEHDMWKTGVRSTTSSNAVNNLEVFGGVTSSKTRDVLPHGKISGTTIKSPKIFIGCFSDWRDGLETYGRANAIIAAPRPWTNGVPFGWNSWGKLQSRISFEKAVQVSDFFARELQPNHFQNDGTVYIGLDSGWNNLSEVQLKEFVAHCASNHQRAGVYFTPFTSWGRGTNKYGDIFLRANGQKEYIDSGTALDPTHPGTRKLIEDTIKRFKDAGFAYIKADFLTHGILEADHYYDPAVTTGVQAYNAGMKYVSQLMGPDMYLNLSIASLFPSQYSDSRRIACDTFGDIEKIEYTLNSLSYGWWLSRVYDFNDPDHVVLDGYSEGENRARVTSAVITGLFTSGDDFSLDGSPEGEERARKFLTNPEINAVARIKKSFRPVEGNTASHAAQMFAYNDKTNFYLAVFNYSDNEAVLTPDLGRIGWHGPDSFVAKELWSGQTISVNHSLTIRVPPSDAALYRFY